MRRDRDNDFLWGMLAGAALGFVLGMVASSNMGHDRIMNIGGRFMPRRNAEDIIEVGNGEEKADVWAEPGETKYAQEIPE